MVIMLNFAVRSSTAGRRMLKPSRPSLVSISGHSQTTRIVRLTSGGCHNNLQTTALCQTHSCFCRNGSGQRSFHRQHHKQVMTRLPWLQLENQRAWCHNQTVAEGPPWRILFFGTDDFSLPNLQALHQDKY